MHINGKALKRARLERGYSLEDVASRIAVSRQTIFNWENERSRPHPLMVRGLATVLGTSVKYLTTEEGQA